jgi:hypothetical protein
MTTPDLLPGFGQSRTARDPDPPKDPTPEDPREHEPMRDPPIYPEHDDGEGEVRQTRGIRGIEAPDPSPDSTVSDEP